MAPLASLTVRAKPKSATYVARAYVEARVELCGGVVNVKRWEIAALMNCTPAVASSLVLCALACDVSNVSRCITVPGARAKHVRSPYAAPPHLHNTVGVEQQVRWLHVAVHEPGRVHIRQRFEALVHDVLLVHLLKYVCADRGVQVRLEVLCGAQEEHEWLCE